ncbi:MAG TPA: protein kinase, partial [Patescibacteria group bacterium]|nr:protein kinase [Patescibacteria group bacterium]
RIAASLNHPNVIPIYDTGPCGELLYIAMRYVAGSDLRAVLKAHERISPAQALTLIGQAGRALDAAHRHGLVHRDVKPANILIERGADDEPDHVYLADFGITKNALSRSGLTETGQFVGTIDYIAPEQIQGKPVDGRADIYSLGCVLYECLTGQVPFRKDLDAAVIWAHVEELPTAPSAIRAELPRGIDDVIARALAKDPNDRYQTSRELIGAARGALDAGPQRSGATVASSDIGPASPTVLSGVSAERPGSAGTVSAASPESDGGSTAPAQSLAPPPPGGGSGDAGGPPASDHLSHDRQAPSIPRSGRWRRLAPVGIVAALILAGGIIAVASSGGGGSATPTTVAAGEGASATLAAVPANRVSGAGTATLRLNGDVATATIDAHGLLNEAPHAMHIHAGGLGTCPPASAARLHNGHLAISTTDGIRFYGPPEAALTTSGDSSVKSFLVFSRFPRTGTIRYQRQIPLSPQLVKRIRANNAVVVIHGIDYDSNGIYDNVLNRSELDNTEPGEATAPALCGRLVAVPPTGGQTATARGRRSRGSRYYVAAL